VFKDAEGSLSEYKKKRESKDRRDKQKDQLLHGTAGRRVGPLGKEKVFQGREQQT
jgi:hypothetical protein